MRAGASVCLVPCGTTGACFGCVSSAVRRIGLSNVYFRSGADSRGYPALNVVFDIERELERADALGAFLSMDEYSPDALVASLELLTKRARHVPQN